MSRRTEQAGVALVAVLWLVALLTVLATAVVTISTGQVRTARAAEQQVRTQLTLDSALRIAIARLSSRQANLDEAATLDVLGEAVRVDVSLERERINVGTADEDSLAELLRAEWPGAEARRMAAQIADWRDADDRRRNGGAEVADYRAAGAGFTPRNASFESIDEVYQLLGGALYPREIESSLTVYGAAGREVGDAHARNDGVAPAGETTGIAGELVRLRACMSRAAVACRIALVRVTGSYTAPLQVFDWR